MARHAVLIVALVLSAAAFLGGNAFSRRTERAAVDLVRSEVRQLAQSSASEFEDGFRQLYLGMRTIARLPGIAQLDPTTGGLAPHVESSAQEIYNSLASTIDLSEIYIVQGDFDPDALDPATGQPQEPLATFDHLIVGRTAGGPSPDHHDHDEAGLPEVEIHEYRLMRRQIARFREICPNAQSIADLGYPACIGEPVVTCDNRGVDPRKPDDARRTGIVYSVPFFREDGSLGGCVSGVVLLDALRRVLPERGAALVSPSHDLCLWREGDELVEANLERGVRIGRAGGELVASASMPVRVVDADASWHVWRGFSDAEVRRRPAFLAAGQSRTLSGVLALVLVAGGLAAWYAGGRLAAQDRRRTQQLEEQVAVRTEELRRSESALRVAVEVAENANRLKTQFLTNMSHEIRTPMTAILGYADLLGDPSQTPTARAQYAQTVRTNGEHLLSIVNDIVDLSKLEQGEARAEQIPTSPCKIVDELRGQFEARARSRGLTLQVAHAFPLPESIVSDPARIKQILRALLDNAVKFTPRGRVELEARLEGTTGDAGTPTLVFEVRDTGPGIAADLLPQMFEAFTQADGITTRRHGGAGLGLALARRLAELIGATLTARSTVGQGSCFVLRVPVRGECKLLHEHPARPAAPRPAADGVELSARILLVEDGVDNQRLIGHHLRRSGALVEFAENGKIAVEKVMGEAQRGSPYDLVLMDMQMPVMDGFDATRELRSKGVACPILALTAHALDTDRERCIQAGCNDYLTKPVQRDVLLEACRRWLAPGSRPASAA